MPLSKEKNVLFLEGNHERWLKHYANDELENIKSSVFLKKTMVEIIELDKSDLRNFYRKLGQIAYFEYDNKQYIVSHGGISYMPEELQLVATEQFVHGVGNYNVNIDEIFSQNNKESSIIQVHAHRNTFEIENERNSYNLEDRIEFGGYLRVLTLEKDKEPQMSFIKNNVFKLEEEETTREEQKEDTTDMKTIIETLRNSKDIRETKLNNNISSFNFTNNAFNRKHWNEITIKSRGLFIDTEKEKVVARGYNKFFNVNEMRETQLEHLIVKFKDKKITCYKKENGFLGILSYVNDELFFATKSKNEGDYVQYFKDIFYNSNINEDKLKDYLKNNDVSLTFEVIDIENDPHIIEYDKSKIVLLDIIHNDFEFRRETYEKVKELASTINCECKTIYKEFNNVRDFHNWYLENTDEDNMSHKDIEGVVIECEEIMTKLKFPYYRFWKFMRGVKEKVRKRHVIKLSTLYNATSNYFLSWAKQQEESTLEKDIITLRNLFEEDKED